jgi:hypothetical protein
MRYLHMVLSYYYGLIYIPGPGEHGPNFSLGHVILEYILLQLDRELRKQKICIHINHPNKLMLKNMVFIQNL